MTHYATSSVQCGGGHQMTTDNVPKIISDELEISYSKRHKKAAVKILQIRVEEQQSGALMKIFGMTGQQHLAISTEQRDISIDIIRFSSRKVSN